MSWSTAALCLLVGWLLGVWMSWRKILKERRLAGTVRRKMAEHFAGQLFQKLQEGDVIKLSVKEGEDGELEFDQDKFDELLGNKTKH